MPSSPHFTLVTAYCFSVKGVGKRKYLANLHISALYYTNYKVYTAIYIFWLSYINSRPTIISRNGH